MALVDLSKSSNLVTEPMANQMKQINDLRQKYVHPLLPEGDSYKDAEKSMNVICRIIDSYLNLKKGDSLVSP